MSGKRKTKSGLNRNGLGGTDNKVTGRHSDLSGFIELLQGNGVKKRTESCGKENML
jgi:hypothetical protein